MSKVPSKEFLSMVVILLRKADAETGGSLVQWLEEFEDNDDNLETDVYDNKSLRLAVAKVLREEYPDPPAPINPADWVEDDEEPEVLPETEKPNDRYTNAQEAELVEDDEEPLPEVEKLPE